LTALAARSILPDKAGVFLNFYNQIVRPLLLAIAFAGSVTAADLCGSVHALVRTESQKQAIPAISVAVIRDNRIICSVALGFADLEQRLPNTVKSRHRLASLSKPVSAVLTMRLVEAGKIALTDSVRKYMPSLPAEYEAITVRRLLAHQSGIREYAGLDEVFSTKHYETLQEAANSIFVRSPLLFEPGTRTAYTTFGYTLLGAALERATGQSFKHILEASLPTFVLDDYWALTPDRVRPYRRASSGVWENAPAFDASNKYPGGGILSTAVEYADFLLQLSGGRILKPATVAEMWTQQKLSNGTVVPFATLGWATGYRGKHRFVTHGGLQPGTTTVMHWFPDLRAGSIILCNAEGPDLDALEEKLLHLLVDPK